MKDKENWVSVITPQGKGINLNFKEIWSYKDLLMLFVKREFVSKYKQTILGPLWAIIQPLLSTVVFTVIFGSLAKLTTADAPTPDDIIIPSFLFYMSGTIVWTYFSTTVVATSNTFIANMNVMGKVYYPRMVTPLASALSNLISFFIQLILFAILVIVNLIMGQAVFYPSAYLLLIPLLIVQLILFSTGVGTIISALTTKYRDLAMLVSFGLELWKYASPVAYGLMLIPLKFQSLYMLNPITPIITTLRFAVFGSGYFSFLEYVVSWIITIFVFLLGMVLFNKTERTFMDTI